MLGVIVPGLVVAAISAIAMISYYHPFQFENYIAPDILSLCMIGFWIIGLPALIAPSDFGASYFLNWGDETGVWCAAALIWARLHYVKFVVGLAFFTAYIALLRFLIRIGISALRRF